MSPEHARSVALLDGLDRVDWGSLAHAYGPASDVPELLRTLVQPGDPSPEIAEAADACGGSVRSWVMQQLWGNLWHQGTVWQASGRAVPFLVEILRDGRDDVELRRFLVRYLHHLALGSPTELFPHAIDPETYFGGAEDAEDDDETALDAPPSAARVARWARDCFVAAEGALDVVRPLVLHRDDDLALEAIALLASFGRADAPASRAAIARVLEGRASALRRAAALVALAQLGDPGARGEAEKHVSSTDRELALHAACACVLAEPSSLGDAALDALTAPLDAEIVEAPSVFTGTLGALVSRCLVRLPPPHHTRAAGALGDALAVLRPLTNLAFTRSLLRLVFPDGVAPTDAAALTAAQERALRAIAARGAFRVGNASFGTYASLLARFDLPTTAEAIEDWLS